MRGLGWTEGGNLRIDWRFTGSDPARLDAAAADLVATNPDVLLTATAAPVAALRQRTQTTPIVFALVSDPIAMASSRASAILAAMSPGSARSRRG